MTHISHWKTENFKKVIFFYDSVILKMIDVNRKSVPKECCGYFSHPLDVLDKVLGPADTVIERRLENCT